LHPLLSHSPTISPSPAYKYMSVPRHFQIISITTFPFLYRFRITTHYHFTITDHNGLSFSGFSKEPHSSSSAPLSDEAVGTIPPCEAEKRHFSNTFHDSPPRPESSASKYTFERLQHSHKYAVGRIATVRDISPKAAELLRVLKR
jgi:hypothetical protein